MSTATKRKSSAKRTPNPFHGTTAQGFLAMHHACADGDAFARRYSLMADVWDNCPRPDWLLWICARLEQTLEGKALRLFACWCVRNTPLADGRTTWGLLTDERSRNAVVVSERFARGEATQQELDAAWDAAWDAAGAAGSARDAAWAAAGAAGSAGAAAWAAAWAAARDAQCTQFRKVIKNPFKGRYLTKAQP